MKVQLFFITVVLILSSITFAEPPVAPDMEQYFSSIKTHPEQLAAFLWEMPKGGDLHIHISGAAYAEHLIRYAQGTHLCVDRQTYEVFEKPDCASDNLFDTAIQSDDFYNHTIDAWSMRHFESGTQTGHDHFFAAFPKFSIIVKKHRPQVLAEIIDRAGLQNESYLELMHTPDNNASGALGKRLGWNPDLNIMRERLIAAGLGDIVNDSIKSIEKDEAGARAILNCQTNHPSIGCQVTVRYIYQVLREQPPEMVFAQLLAGFEAAMKNKQIVGLNLVQPEDGVISMRDYKLHMNMVRILHELYPNVAVSLHAGELDDSLAPPEGLKYHIHDAVTVAEAKRIGHGVDIEQEDDALQLLKEMAQRFTMVEINLSSNFLILNTPKEHHPLPLYMRYQVPLALSTDDEGVSRSNLSKEYELAVKYFNLDYTTLRTYARNSLTYSFLPGKTLWIDNNYQDITPECSNDILGEAHPTVDCDAFLMQHEKAKTQWDLEHRFYLFEQKYAHSNKILMKAR
jgi:adenosine deaminase